jgi:WD40-like Beta Propeller Repeat
MRHCRRISAALLAVMAGAGSTGSAQPPAGPPLNARVTETLMGPRTQRIYLSEEGDHIAIVAPKGSREMLVLDGVEGPAFDELPLNFMWSSSRGSGGPMVFSPTGGHSAYVGRRGGDFIAVVDGKEAATLVTAASMQSGQGRNAPGWGFLFNHDGSRLAYGALAGPGSWVMVADGVKGTPYKGLDLTQSALNGKRLVYVAQTADDQWHAVVDGKAGPGYGMVSSLQVTPDGLHYAYIGNKSGVGARQALVVNDGVETPMYYGVVDLEQAPDGRIAYVATTSPGDAQGRGATAALFVGGLTVPNNTVHFNASTYDKVRIGYRLGYGSHRVAFSPDGKRIAWVQQNTPNPGVTVMVNGKAMGPTYQTADELLWSPDGAHLTYQGTSPTGTFPVIDGEELSGATWVKEFQWSPDGKRYVFQTATSTGVWLVSDGKELQPKPRGLTDGATVFSPVGNHLAYGAQIGASGVSQPVVDGVARPQNIQQFNTTNNPKILFPVFSWSPDGNHLAYVAFTMDQIPKGGVWVDGTLFPGQTAWFQFPSWSPNSKHFATVVTGRAWSVMVDGKVSPSWEEFLALSSAACRFVDDHTFRFYGIKAGQVYRVTLDLGA